MRTILSLLVCGLVVSSVAVAAPPTGADGGEQDFLKEITETIRGAAKDLGDAALPIIETQGKKMWSEVQAEVEKGFADLSSLTNDIDKVVGELEGKLRETVPADAMEKIRGVLSNINEDAIRALADELAGEALKKLDVSAEKFEQVEAILSKDIRERGVLLDKMLGKGKEGLQEFKAANQQKFDQTMGELTGLLSSEDLDTLGAWFDDAGEKIDKLFAERQPLKRSPE